MGGGDGMSLSQCEELMTRLKNKYPIEYKVQIQTVHHLYIQCAVFCCT